jgi:hypothetical protein
MDQNSGFFMAVSFRQCGGRRRSGRDGRGGGHGRADQVGAPAGALAAFEVAVAGGGAALARLQPVGVHRQAHAAARLAPLEAGGLEDLVQALGSACALTRPEPGTTIASLTLGATAADAAHHGGGLAQVLDAAVGAEPMKTLSTDVGDGLVGLQAHVGQRALDGAALDVVAFLVGVGHAASMAAPSRAECPR